MSQIPGYSFTLPNVLIIDGSLGGRGGNSAECARGLLTSLEGKVEVEWLHLADEPAWDLVEAKLRIAEGFVFVTGTYWDSWGSPLQKFFEDSTRLETTDVWLGKPASVVVTMHSVGGKEVLSRAQGVLSSLGLEIPPMSGMVFSLANQMALQAASDSAAAADLWRLSDLEAVARNLILAVRRRRAFPVQWDVWPVDETDPRRKWLLLPE